MKNTRTVTNLFLVTGLALVTLIGCQREKEMGQVINPNLTEDGNAVKTKFILNVSTASGPEETKTTADMVQAGKNSNFLGMDKVHMLTYSLGHTGGIPNFYFNPWKNASEKIANTRDFNLGTLFPESSAANFEQTRSLELALPLDTDCVVLYGKAKKTQTSDLQGAVTEAGDPADLSSLRFSLTPRLDDEDKFIQGAAAFSRILNYILCAGLVQESRTIEDGAEVVNTGFWRVTTGINDERYGFWWPIPESGSDAETDLTAFAESQGFIDANGKLTNEKKSTYTYPGPADYQVTVPTLDNQGNPTYADEEHTIPNTHIEHRDYSNYKWHQGQLSWKQLGQMYRYKYDSSSLGTEPESITPQQMSLSPLGETLGEAYQVLTKIEFREADVQKKDDEGNPMYDDEGHAIMIKVKTLTELRAGSAAAILRTMEDLYAIVDKASQAHSTSWEEYVCKKLAILIKGRMNKFFVSNANGFFFRTASGDGIFTDAEITALIDELENYLNPTDNFDVTKMKQFLNKDYFPYEGNVGFPLNLNLPGGAACLECDVVDDMSLTDYAIGFKQMDTFRYTMDIPAYGMGSATFPLVNYRYPAEIMYYGNSPIRVNDNVVSSWPSGATAWDGQTWWQNQSWANNGGPGVVSSTTRSVAMINHINYGTAMLRSRIMYTNATLKDNNKAIHTSEEDNDVDVNGLVITGVVLGGQPDDVCWDFTRAANGDDIKWKWVSVADEGKVGHFTDNGADIDFGENKFNKMIYDKVAEMPISAFKTDATDGSDNVTTVYTPCWDNYDASSDADQQQTVYVALEIRNDTGKDFWGELNLIRQGGTFYLVGKLDMYGDGSTVTKPFTLKEGSTWEYDLSRKNYAYPPFNPETGATINVPRIFMQDYVTTANLLLGQDCLKHAYVTVPDLRSSQISLGLFIDISWSKGMTFNVNLGEN